MSRRRPGRDASAPDAGPARDAATDPGTRIAAANTAFTEGRISRVWEGIQDLLTPSAQAGLTAAQRDSVQFLQLGCALYHVGDLAAARDLNARLPAESWTTMRYRLSLRLRDPATARRLRRASGLGPREEADFRTSAGLHALWAHRHASGFRLFAHRHAAINFPKVMPARLRHAPLPDDPTEDAGIIVLEQGLGEVLFHLAHIRAQGHHAGATFTGQARFAPLIGRYFPQARFVPAEALPDVQPPPAAHLAGDFVARGYRRNGTIAPGLALDSPTRHAFDAPVFGLCWRGGSGQNRREERHVPLAFLLDMLPLGARFLALQFDITPAERRLLEADPRCSVPLADLTRDPLATLDMIRPLAGVISVDSANWHMAGFSGVPLLAVMNRTAHWFWGPQADAASVFDSATTLPKSALSPEAIADFTRDATALWQRRPAAPLPLRHDRPPPGIGAVDRPLFICGVPRSGTSLATRVLAAQGLWLGQTIAGNADNPEGYHENRRIRETQLKPLLRALGADPRGVAPLPRTEALPPFPDLARRLRATLREEGYAGQRPWGYKDPKLTLVWPLFAKAFPGATWLVVRRDAAATEASLARASFMRQHSTAPEFWSPFRAAYEARLRALETSGATVFTLQAEALMAGDASALDPVARAMGLPLDAGAATRALRRGA